MLAVEFADQNCGNSLDWLEVRLVACSLYICPILPQIAMKIILPINKILIALCFSLSSLTMVSLPARTQIISQTESDRVGELTRAMNLARQAAEKANGGIEKYRVEPAMQGPAIASPYQDNGDGTLTFTFRGGTPGSDTYTVETVVTVAQDGSRVNVDYNGSIR